MPELRPRVPACALGAALLLCTTSVAADWPLALRGPEVTLMSTDAPRTDAGATRDAVSQHLLRSRARLDRCIQGIELREDPLRRRTRAVSSTLTFARGGRASVRVDRSDGVPPAAVSCVRELLASARARPVPRGEVVLRVRYVVGPR